MWCPNQECPDARESGSPAEFVEGKTECPFCGAELVTERPAWADAEEEIRLAPVMPILDGAWLPRVKAILDEAGVRFQLQEAGAPSRIMWGHYRWDPYDRAPVILVEEGDLERAVALLADLQAEVGLGPGEEPQELTAPAWQPSTCPKCGKTLETSEGDEPLAYCYHCGASLSTPPS